MRPDRIDISPSELGPSGQPRSPRTPLEAAEQFEHVLVRQMVQAMTKDLFDHSLAGDDGPQWMGAYGDMQGDVLADELARHLTRDGRLGIADLLVQQWQRLSGEADSGTSEHTGDQT